MLMGTLFLCRLEEYTPIKRSCSLRWNIVYVCTIVRTGTHVSNLEGVVADELTTTHILCLLMYICGLSYYHFRAIFIYGKLSFMRYGEIQLIIFSTYLNVVEEYAEDKCTNVYKYRKFMVSFVKVVAIFILCKIANGLLNLESSYQTELLYFHVICMPVCASGLKS